MRQKSDDHGSWLREKPDRWTNPSNHLRTRLRLRSWARVCLRSFALASIAIAATAHATTQPIAAWQLDEGSGTTTADASGNAKTGTLTNGVTWTTGHSGNALSFDGGTGYVTVNGGGVLANLRSTGVTVSAWIRPASSGAGGGGRVLDKNGGGGGWVLKMNEGVLQFSGDSFATASARRNSAAAVSMNTWQHVVATWDGSTSGSQIHVYVNGVASDGVTSDGAGAVIDDSTGPLGIGNRPSDAARGFDGLIDDVRVYDRVLTANEVLGLYSGDVTAPTVPGGLTATATSSTQINVSWSASTDNIGVAQYLLERCEGSSCSNFVQVAAIAGTSYSNTGLAAQTSYRYRVRAIDAAGNSSGYSTIVGASTQASPAVQSVANWSFNEGSGTTIADASGNGKTGTLANGVTWATGHSGNALSFDGGTGYVTVNGGGVLANLRSTGVTVSAWVKLASSGAGGGGRVLDKNGGGGGWVLKMNGNSLQFSGDSFATASARRDSAVAMSMNTWQHVAATWDGSTSGSQIHVYVNGVASDGVTSDGAGAVIDDSAGPLGIGNRPSDAARGFDGLIDDVQVYNRVLTPSEVLGVYNGVSSDTQAPSAPAAFSAIAATTSGTRINLTWTASTDNTAVTGYLIERCTGASCSNFVQVATSTSAGYSDTGLSPSTAYSYRIRARDAANNMSTYSTTATATTIATATGQPSKVVYEYDAAGRLRIVSWPSTQTTYTLDAAGNRTQVDSGVAPGVIGSIAVPAGSTTGDYTIDWTDSLGVFNQYELYESTNTAFSGTPLKYVVTGGSLKAISGKGVGTYYYRVRACMDTKCGPYTTGANGTTVQLPPGIPASIAVPASSETGSYSISWGASADELPSTLYELYEATNASFSGETRVFNAHGYATSMAGKANGTYYYRVRACNGTACSGVRTGSNALIVAPPQAPGVPGAVVVITSGDPTYNNTGNYTVQWTAPAPIPGATVTKYELLESIAFGGETLIYSGLSTSQLLTGRAEHTYSYRVRACNGTLCSAYTSEVGSAAVIMVDKTPPTPPVVVSFGSILLSWGNDGLGGNPGSDTGGSGLPTWNVYRDGAYLTTVTYPSQGYISDPTSPTNVTVTYTVKGLDRAGNLSAPSNVITKYVDTLAPSTPGNLHTTVVAINQVSLAWDASSDPNATSGNGISFYQVVRSPGGSLVTSDTYYDDVSVESGVTYTYTVTAYDNRGGPPSAAATIPVPVPVGAPPVPTMNSGQLQYNTGDYYVIWTPGSGSGSVTYYVLEEQPEGGPWGPTVVNAPETSKHIQFQPNGEYRYRVKACTASNTCSGYSNTRFLKVCAGGCP
jgi:chitodextrinase